MRAHIPKIFDSDRSVQSSPMRDITWDRSVFRPPLLPNPQVNFDPLPFMAHRRSVTPRRALIARRVD